MGDVNYLPPSEGSSTYSHNTSNFGNPMLNFMLSRLFGQNLAPRPSSGEDMYDAFVQRQRSQHFLHLQSSGAANNVLFKALGMSNAMTNTMSQLVMSSPESAAGKFLSPFMGGNPMAASMQLYGGLTGVNAMGNFGGRMSNISVGETEATMNALMDVMFKTQSYEGPGGAREEMNKKHQQELLKLAEDSKNDEILRKRGINVARDANGQLTEASKRQISSFEIARGYDDPEKQETTNLRNAVSERRQTANKLQRELSEVLSLSEDDKDKQKKLKDLRKEVSSELGLSKKAEDEMFDAKTFGTKGAKDASKAIESYAKLTPDEKAAMKAEAVREAGKVYKGINYENSLGLKVEDFTSGFVRAANLRGMGETQGKSIAGQMQDFAKNSAGAMSAARSIFGDKSGGELVSKISEMMGEKMNLGTQQGGQEAEKFLRDAKATADVAGVSIKTMLGIIDSTKELMANNPRLANISSYATTKMAVNAIAKTADIAAGMSAKEYQRAGGTTGILSTLTQENNAFLESGISQQIAGISSMTKGLGTMTDENGQTYDPHSQFLEMVRKGEITARTLATGEAQQKISRITQGKVNAAAITRAGTDPLAAAMGMKDTDTVTALSEGADAVVNQTFWDSSRGYGLNRESVLEQIKTEREKQKRGEAFKTPEEILQTEASIALAGDPQKMEAFTRNKRRLTQGLVDELRTPEEKERLQKTVKERSDQAARLERVFAHNRYGVAPQMLNALLEGKSFEETADVMAGIFATKDTARGAKKQAIDKAIKAGENLSYISEKAAGSQEKFKQLGGVAAINEIIAGRIADAQTRGESTNLNANISTEEYENELAVLKDTDLTNAKGARARLEDLERQSYKVGIGGLGDKQRKELYALQTAFSAGHLESDSAFSLAKKGTYTGLAAATIEGQKSKNIERAIETEKNSAFDVLGKQLTDAATKQGEEGDQARSILDFYSKQLNLGLTDPADIANNPEVRQRILEDYSDPTKHRDRNYFADSKGQFKQEFSGKTTATTDALRSAQDKISQIESTIKTPAEEKANAGSNEALQKALTDLAAQIKDGGKIGTVLDQFVTALKAI